MSIGRSISSGLFDEVQCEQAPVYLEAYPGVGGGVDYLCAGEAAAAPVGSLLGFGDSKAEDNGGKTAQAGVDDSQLLCKCA